VEQVAVAVAPVLVVLEHLLALLVAVQALSRLLPSIQMLITLSQSERVERVAMVALLPMALQVAPQSLAQ
jgi:hypothetical protein